MSSTNEWVQHKSETLYGFRYISHPADRPCEDCKKPKEEKRARRGRRGANERVGEEVRV